MDVTYNSAQLNFNGWSPDEILAQIESHSFENHLNEIYVCLGSNIQINEKLNVLCYFESIIINSTVANRLINSAFVNLLTKMLRVSKSP
jgi:serine/threonine-protein kinase ULK4